MGCIESICKLGNTSYSTSQPRNRQKLGSGKYKASDNRKNFGYYTYGGGDGVGKYLVIFYTEILTI